MSDSYRFCIAPMIRLTDRHARYFLRRISRHARLYTEMITTGAILHGESERLLAFDPDEHPLALQLGGCEPRDLAACARIGQDYGYDEINLNVGCPSNRVQSGRFGACLMAKPALVAECVAAMRGACSLPVTVKCRIGIDDQEDYAALYDFSHTVSQAGCQTFIVHARKAWLAGLSPKENREIPPLRYELVHRLKRDLPELTIVLNGGLLDLDSAAAQLEDVDGVMLGRAAYYNPYLLAEVDRRFFSAKRPILSRHQIVESMLPYLDSQQAQGVPLKAMTRHMLALFHACPKARSWRRRLSEETADPKADTDLLRKALQAMPDPERIEFGQAA